MSCEVAYRVRAPHTKARWTRLVNAALKTLHHNPATTNVSLAFIGDREMRALNARFRNQPQTTDVLSFPGSGRELGEVLVAVPLARRQARHYGHPLGDELDLLVVHGLLHLVGYDHHRLADRRRMENMEQRILRGRSLVQRSGQ